ncbi:hypothetical protein BDV93DRAFT_502211 [Ceratobasidium sp. AG-I]|nr:hypothetical protein BDV93DRAFT_502211 [Ceratobasidium sp. AG-I]
MSGLGGLAASLVLKAPTGPRPGSHNWITSVDQRWDALYYHDVALRGTYLFEQQYAFSPSVPVVLRLVDLARCGLRFLIQSSAEPIPRLSGLTKGATLSDDFALLATAVQALMGAPPVMLRSADAEPFFAWSSFKGMRACHDRRYCVAALYFALATSFRTNGILLSGFILYDQIARPVLSETISALSKTTHTSLQPALLLTALVLSPFVAHQDVAYAAFCIGPVTTATEPLYSRLWCASRLPMIYGFVQSHYWDVGFLQYWTVAQFPNFFIAAPMLVLAGGSNARSLSAVCVVGKRAGGGGRVNNSKSNTRGLQLISTSMALTFLPCALHALVLSMILFTSAHVQIAIRVLPAATPWAAWAGPRCCWAFTSHLWIGWSAVWVFVRSVLWLAFLPPA